MQPGLLFEHRVLICASLTFSVLRDATRSRLTGTRHVQIPQSLLDRFRQIFRQFHRSEIVELKFGEVVPKLPYSPHSPYSGVISLWSNWTSGQ